LVVRFVICERSDYHNRRQYRTVPLCHTKMHTCVSKRPWLATFVRELYRPMKMGMVAIVGRQPVSRGGIQDRAGVTGVAGVSCVSCDWCCWCDWCGWCSRTGLV